MGYVPPNKASEIKKGESLTDVDEHPNYGQSLLVSCNIGVLKIIDYFDDGPNNPEIARKSPQKLEITFRSYFKKKTQQKRGAGKLRKVQVVNKRDRFGRR